MYFFLENMDGKVERGKTECCSVHMIFNQTSLGDNSTLGLSSLEVDGKGRGGKDSIVVGGL